MQDKKPNSPAEASGASRRDFMKTSVVAGTAAAATTSLSARSFLRIQGANERLHIGMLGVGGMGGGHTSALLNLAAKKKENIDIVAIADVAQPRVDDKVGQVKNKQGGDVQGTQHFEEVLARDDVDAVWIASPEHWHAPMAIAAINAKKDAYVEKPMTLRLAEAIELHKAASASSQIVGVGTQYVMNPKYKKAAELIADGAIGHPVTSQTSYCRNSKTGEWNYYKIDKRIVPGETLDWKKWCGPLGEAPWDPLVYHRWRRYRKYSTGIIGDLLVHEMTPLVNAVNAGWPTRVTAAGGHYIDKKMENHDQVNILVQFERDHTMTVVGSTANEIGLETRVRGHEGTMYLSGSNCNVKPERIYADEVDEHNHKLPSVNHDHLRRNFLSSVRSRKPTESPVELGLKIMVIVDLATRSMWDGKSYVFDAKTMTASPA